MKKKMTSLLGLLLALALTAALVGPVAAGDEGETDPGLQKQASQMVDVENMAVEESADTAQDVDKEKNLKSIPDESAAPGNPQEGPQE